MAGISKTERIIRQFSSKPEQRTAIASAGGEGIFIPNHSGDHSEGRVLRTPENTTDIVNKTYADTKAALVHTHLLAAGATDVTATAAELNIMDGVTATAAELNVLDGIPVTLTAVELGYSDGLTGATQTQIDNLTTTKIAKNVLEAQGDMIYASAAGTPARLAPGVSGYFLKTQGAAANPAWAAVTFAGRLLSISLLTAGAGATYTVPAGVTFIWMRMVAGGGGGGGTAGGAAQVSVGGGGGAGGFLEEYTTATPGNTATYTIGGAGAGGTAGGNNGTAGGNTIFQWDSGGPIRRAWGGGGGNGQATPTNTFQIVPGSINSGVSTNGDVNSGGSHGGHGIILTTTYFISGAGGHNALGIGGSSLVAAGTGNVAIGYGGGGGGACSSGVGDYTGGAGTAGIIYIFEFT